MVGFPHETVAFRGHGLDADRASGTVLVVNHGLLNGGERIEHFSYHLPTPTASTIASSSSSFATTTSIPPVTDGGGNSGDDKVPVPPTLVYRQSVAREPLLGEAVMNDVAIYSAPLLANPAEVLDNRNVFGNKAPAVSMVISSDDLAAVQLEAAPPAGAKTEDGKDILFQSVSQIAGGGTITRIVTAMTGDDDDDDDNADWAVDYDSDNADADAVADADADAEFDDKSTSGGGDVYPATESSQQKGGDECIKKPLTAVPAESTTAPVRRDPPNDGEGSNTPLGFFTSRFMPFARDLNASAAVEDIKKAVNIAAMLFNLPGGHIVYCEERTTVVGTATAAAAAAEEPPRPRAGEFECSIPEGQGYTGSVNGLVLSRDKSRLIVADFADRCIVSYQIVPRPRSTSQKGQGRGLQLRLLGRVRVPHMLDNIVLDEEASSGSRDVLTLGGLSALHLAKPVVDAFTVKGYDQFRAPTLPTDADAPLQGPSAIQIVTIDYAGAEVKVEAEGGAGGFSSEDGSVSKSNSGAGGGGAAADLTIGPPRQQHQQRMVAKKVEVLQQSSDGTLSVAARRPTPNLTPKPSSSSSSSSPARRTWVLGSFIEHYIMICDFEES